MRGVIYGNVLICNVRPDALSGTLTVSVVYAERERQSAVYSGVLYSQLDASAEGKTIAVVMELSPDELRDNGHRPSVERLLRECGLQSLDPIEEMSRRGYRLFAHYMGAGDECIVVAKGLRVSEVI